jgi:uncharacterized coiled-coil DUF342 family protein
MGAIDLVTGYLSQLGDDRIEAAVKSVDERAFERQRSPLDFDTAVERLRSCRDIVDGAIQNGFFATLPQSVQKELSPLLNVIVQDVANITGGSDSLEDFAVHVDQLHAYIWVNRLAEKSTRIVNYTQKLDQLTKLLGEAQKLNAEFHGLAAKGAEVEAVIQQSQQAVADATKALADTQAASEQTAQCSQQAQEVFATLNQTRTEIDSLFTQSTAALQEMNTLAEEMRRLDQESQQACTQTAQHAQDAQSALAAANERNAQVQALLTTAQASIQEMSTIEVSLRNLNTEASSLHAQTTQHAQETQDALTAANERNAQVNDLLAQARSSNQEIATFQTELKKLSDEAQEFRDRISKTEQAAQDTVNENSGRTQEIQKELAKLEEEIKVALQKAVGSGLFGTFYERSTKIGRGKWIWAVLTGLFGLGTIYWVSHIAYTCGDKIGPPLYFKLAVALPLGLVVWFCMVQYNRERRLEEEYAFKSSISFSLVPYKDLVEKIIVQQGEAGRDKYSQFVIDSIGKVFTTPIEHKDGLPTIDIKQLSREQLKVLAELISIALGRAK